jgi:uncharacterized damage-inducible protein DinB
MYRKINDFMKDWKYESALTAQVLDALTDESLAQEIAPGMRNLGQLAYHMVTSIPQILKQTGLQFESEYKKNQVPTSAKAIAAAYRTISQRAAEAVESQWTDDTLFEKKDIYGQPWPNRVTLHATISHEVHHRGQLSILMRQAGLTVPAIYGPNYEQTQQFAK